MTTRLLEKIWLISLLYVRSILDNCWDVINIVRNTLLHGKIGLFDKLTNCKFRLRTWPTGPGETRGGGVFVLNFDLYIALLMTAKMGGCSIGCFGRVLWVDFRTVWGLRPIYRIDMCARMLGSTSMSMGIHTAPQAPTAVWVLQHKSQLYIFGGGGCHRKYHLKKWNIFCDKKFYLRTYGFSRCLKKRSPWVGELFTFDWTDTILNNILFNLTEHILVRSPRLAIDSFLPGCGRWVQKFAHASISLPLNYTVAPC